MPGVLMTESTLDNDTVDSAEQIFEQDSIDKCINFVFCRWDLAHEKLEAEPVGFCQLFCFGSKLDKVLVSLGIFLSIVCGMAQPTFIIINGKLVDLLLLTNDVRPS
ncbi:hypothetical protein L596_000120 [Steinernema carpocapsae]|uniref:Uncharacterized protein n=1 Tax=Steinernema carpocapsae TaxID=34508 RepID=A0A4V6I711_STECR|nr:hypothetical protein L596_000120 [Steinernema carpocapsae]